MYYFANLVKSHFFGDTSGIGVDPGKVGGYFPLHLNILGGTPPPPSNGVLRSLYIHLLIIIVYYLICVVSVTLN